MINTYKIEGKVLLLSGLHIGGSDAGVKIGGIDTPIIKNPISGLPYIPGSSLKGKMRFLLEHYFDVVKGDGVSKATVNGKTNQVAIVFGHMDHESLNFTAYPTRIIVRDSQVIGAVTSLDNTDPEHLNSSMLDVETASRKMNSLFVEGKTEVAIDRLTGTVSRRGGLRQIERVPAGAIFNLEIVLRSFVEGEDEKNLDIIKKGLRLLENDALGGYGSRGSGRIKLYDLKIGDTPFDLESVTL